MELVITSLKFVISVGSGLASMLPKEIPSLSKVLVHCLPLIFIRVAGHPTSVSGPCTN